MTEDLIHLRGYLNASCVLGSSDSYSIVKTHSMYTWPREHISVTQSVQLCPGMEDSVVSDSVGLATCSANFTLLTHSS